MSTLAVPDLALQSRHQREHLINKILVVVLWISLGSKSVSKEEAVLKFCFDRLVALAFEAEPVA